jgi:hypothetical protein
MAENACYLIRNPTLRMIHSFSRSLYFVVAYTFRNHRLGMKSPKCSEYSTIRIVETNESSGNKLNGKYVYLVDVFNYL